MWKSVRKNGQNLSKPLKVIHNTNFTSLTSVELMSFCIENMLMHQGAKRCLRRLAASIINEPILSPPSVVAELLHRLRIKVRQTVFSLNIGLKPCFSKLFLDTPFASWTTHRSTEKGCCGHWRQRQIAKFYFSHRIRQISTQLRTFGLTLNKSLEAFFICF